jgi:hypothetical protein
MNKYFVQFALASFSMVPLIGSCPERLHEHAGHLAGSAKVRGV